MPLAATPQMPKYQALIVPSWPTWHFFIFSSFFFFHIYVASSRIIVSNVLWLPGAIAWTLWCVVLLIPGCFYTETRSPFPHV